MKRFNLWLEGVKDQLFLSCFYGNGDPDRIKEYVATFDNDLKRNFQEYENNQNTNGARMINEVLSKMDLKFTENLQEFSVDKDTRFHFHIEDNYREFLSKAQNGLLLLSLQLPGKTIHFACANDTFFEIEFLTPDIINQYKQALKTEIGRNRDADNWNPTGKVFRVTKNSPNLHGFQKDCAVYLLAQLWQIPIL